jgi:hypothetical protein
MVSDNPLFKPRLFLNGENSTTMAFHASQNGNQLTNALRPIQQHRA